MSTITLRQDQQQPARNPNRVLGIALALVAIVAAIALLATNPHLLVALSSDRDGQALLPTSTLAPGSSTTGALILTNEGLLPLRYDVKIEAGQAELDSGVIIRLRRNDEPNFFYQGPITSDPVTIGFLAPGQHTRLEVTLSAPAAAGGSAAIPVDDTFVWTAHSPGFEFWWWLLLVAAALVVAAVLLPRLLDFYARVRRLPMPRFELFWRAPVALAAVILAMLVPLSGVSLASINAQASNPSNVFAIGSVVLNNRTTSGGSCISAAGAGGQTANGQCGAIFSVSNAAGTTASGRLTVRNAGTVPVSQLSLWASTACATTSAAPIHGGGDLCQRVEMTIHDDSHDRCYFPDNRDGPCTLRASGTMGSFASRYAPGSALSLSPSGLGSGLTYTFTVALDPTAGNEYQGRLATLDFSWEIAQ
jgi:hypothetical protein